MASSNIQSIPKISFIRHLWSFDRGDYDLFKNQSCQYRSDPGVNTHAIYITDRLNSLTAECIPNKTVRIRLSDPPWITTAIRKLIRKRKRACHKAKQSDTSRLWNNLKKRRNKIVQSIRRSKQQYLDLLSSKLKSKPHPLRTGGPPLKLSYHHCPNGGWAHLQRRHRESKYAEQLFPQPIYLFSVTESIIF